MFKRAAITLTLMSLAAAPAFAWGSAGHRIINQVAIQNLPDSMPAFLRTPEAMREITELGPEMDRIKGSGYPHDADEDPGHYVDANDDLTIAGGLSLMTLPDSREAYDTALRTAKTDQYKEGYLPYSIADGWETVRKDFAYWRADTYLAQHAAAADDRAWFEKDRTLREDLTLRDLGVWGHYVADGSQPLHVTNHFNGWGKFPNPKHYSTSMDVHSDFESKYVNNFAKRVAVDTLVKASSPESFINAGSDYKAQTAQAVTQIHNYLGGSAKAVIPLYELEAKSSWSGAESSANTAFVDQQLARGAQELRDLIMGAYESSLTQTVAYPPIKVQDILNGKTVPTAKQFGSD